jgi:predicted site-specific integrase-resolvase
MEKLVTGTGLETMLTFPQLERLGYGSARALRQWAREGRIPTVKLPNGQWRVLLSTARQLQESRAS